MTCKDSLILSNITSDTFKKIIEDEKKESLKTLKLSSSSVTENEYLIEFPLDDEIIGLLVQINTSGNTEDEFFLFKQEKEINVVWNTILEKSIKCLRFFDTREPFITNPNKHPIAYGVKDIGEYFTKYSNFEKMLYGGAKYYRDHVIHVFRVWMLGIFTLLQNSAEYLHKIEIDSDFQFNSLEKISVWSMIALTHDLGYPLEKSQEIIDTTREMMKCFIQNPKLSMDLSFNGIQNNMNDFVLRFMSSKMKRKVISNLEENDNVQAPQYVARLQPKYYFKLQKSLEKFKHGTISAIIIYKMLLFFLESDFNINEDYNFGVEDARQFYIRREILRAIASHTCKDIYHLKMGTFSFLLIIIDDCQDWGRKNISELYVKKTNTYNFDSITTSFKENNTNTCKLKESFEFEKDSSYEIKRVLKNLYRQFNDYCSLFRDGQDTKNRDFSVSKECTIKINDSSVIKYVVEFLVSNTNQSTFTIIQDGKSTQYSEKFLIEVFEDMLPSKDKKSVDSHYKKIDGDKTIYSLKLTR